MRTAARGLLLTVTVGRIAIPVYLAAPQKAGWSALLHAGWRGDGGAAIPGARRGDRESGSGLCRPERYRNALWSR